MGHGETASSPRVRRVRHAPSLTIPTKLSPPPVPGTMVDRPRLRRILDRAVDGPFTLISAPPGSGKTVLLADWFRARPRRWLAWLSCEASDAHVPAFWGQVVAAIQRSRAADASPSLQNLTAPRTDRDDAFMARLIEAISALPRPLILVIDDAQELSRGKVADRLRRLVWLAPPQLRLVVSSRRDPFVPLSRLRAGGGLTEIRGRDLMFTVDEAGELLAGLGVPLPPESLETLVARTEGWAAGLRLAALHLAAAGDVDAAIHRFAGTDQVVADYLVEQVLAGHRDMTRFLLFTSVVDRFTAELARALTGEDRTAPILDELRRDNLVSMVDNGWMRYHGLVAELLRSRLRAEFPAEVPRLHAAAAQWFGEREQLSASVRHASLARNAALLARTVRDVSLVQALGDQGSEIQPLLEQHSAGSALRQAGPRVTLAATRLAVRDPNGALRLVAGISGGNGSNGTRVPRRVEARATVVGLAAARQLADLPNTLRWGRRAEGIDLNAFDNGEGEWVRASVLANSGWASLWAGPVGEAVETLEEAAASATAIDDAVMQIDSQALLSVALAWMARATMAQRTAGSVVGFADQRGLGSALELAPAFLALAWVHDQRGAVDSMAEALDRSREITRGEEPADSPLTAAQLALMARLHRWRGEPAVGANLLSALRRKLRDPGHRLLAEAMAIEEAGMLTAAGREASALDVLGEEPRQLRTTADQVVRARLAVMSGHPADAITTLLTHLGRELLDHVPDMIEAWVVLALTQVSTGDDIGAWESFERALFMASDERLIRPFLLDDGVAGVAEAQLEAGTEHGELCRELIDRLHALGPDPAASPPAEELSRRERVVLRYLATLMSVQEIADAMFVSTNTVKTHVKHIYRKLDVSRRRDAVDSARALRLLRNGDGAFDRPFA